MYMINLKIRDIDYSLMIKYLDSDVLYWGVSPQYELPEVWDAEVRK